MIRRNNIATSVCLLIVVTSTCWGQVVEAPSAQSMASGKLHAETLIKTSTSWNGAKLPSYPAGQPEITVMRITIPAGFRLPFHKHPVINAGVVLSGELTVNTAAGDHLVLKSGDPIVEVVDTWHYGWNRGDTPVDIVVFYAGIKGQKITIKQPERQPVLHNGSTGH